MPRPRLGARAAADAEGPNHRLYTRLTHFCRGADRQLSGVSLGRAAQSLARLRSSALRRLVQRLSQPDGPVLRGRPHGSAIRERDVRDLPSRHSHAVQSPLAHAAARGPNRAARTVTTRTATLTAAYAQDRYRERELAPPCHAEKRGPFLFEHAPVRDSCVNCHTPHGSNQHALLVAPIPFLCQQCHSHTRHPNDLLTAQSLGPGANPDERLLARGCITCHAQVHGSNHPSGARFHR